MSAEQERKRFEEWANNENTLIPSNTQRVLSRYMSRFSELDGHYYNMMWQLCWEAWQARGLAEAGDGKGNAPQGDKPVMQVEYVDPREGLCSECNCSFNVHLVTCSKFKPYR